jgi:hypothetical protein
MDTVYRKTVTEPLTATPISTASSSVSPGPVG